MFGGYNHARLKLIEAYDHHETKWTHLPDMISGRYRHGAVSMGNKLFVIVGNLNETCEVFESCSRKFTTVKEILKPKTSGCKISTLCIGYKILLFSWSEVFPVKQCLIYDVLVDEWKLEENKLFGTDYVQNSLLFN